MNYFTLLGRLLLIIYSVFLTLFAIDKGITDEGFSYIIPPVLILFVISILWNRPLISAVIVFIFFLVSIWFFNTLENLGVFFIISMPLAIASILFLLGGKVKDIA